MTERQVLEVAVVMQRRPLANRWQPWQWRPLEIVELEPGSLPVDAEPRCLLNDEGDQRWLHGPFEVELFRDEAEGYFLNVDSPQPSWFVMWRMDEECAEESGFARPRLVTLSYNEGARLMDGGETVEVLPAPAHVVEALRGFVAEHYRPEPKRKRLKPSFEGGAGVERMARAELAGKDAAGKDGGR